MNSENLGFKNPLGIITIPTLAGMGILLLGLIAGVYLVTQNQILKSKASISFVPKEINIVNLSANSAAIYWKTEDKTIGYIQAGASGQPKSTYWDDRDQSAPCGPFDGFLEASQIVYDSYEPIFDGPTTLHFIAVRKDEFVLMDVEFGEK